MEPNSYRPYRLDDPAAPFIRPCGFPNSVWTEAQLSVRSDTLAGFRLHSEFCRANPSRRRRSVRGSSHGLCLPTAHQAAKVHERGLCLPATFRLQGLATLLTAFSLHCPAGFVSHRRRSWDSPFGAFSTRKVTVRSRSVEPTCRLPADRHDRRGGDREPEYFGFWAFTLASIPCAPAKD